MPLKKLSYLVLLLITLITGVSIYYTTKLRFDYNFNNFFPKHDPDFNYYEDYSRKFGNDNDYLLIGISNEKGIFRPGFLQKIDSLTQFLKTQRHVANVLSPTRLTKPVIEPFGFSQILYLHLNQPERLFQDSIGIYKSAQYVGTLFSEDGKAVSLVIQTTKNLLKLPSDTLLVNIQEAMARLKLPEYHLAGRAVAQSIFVDRMQAELAIFMSLGILLVTVVLFITFRTWWGILMPLLVVLMAIIWALGLMGFFDTPLDLMTVLLPTIMFVVGMSDSVHILTQYVTEIAEGKDKITAIRNTVKDVGMATFITALTTSIGFFTLLTADIAPIRHFGLYTGLAVGMAYVLSMTLLPAMMVLMPIPLRPQTETSRISWTRILTRLLLWVLKFRKRIIPGAIVLTLLAGYSISTIKIDATLLDDLAEDDPVRVDFKYFEEKFAGVRPFEMHLQATRNRKIFDPEVLTEINKIEFYLQNQYGIDFILSPNTIVKNVNQAINGGLDEYYRLPNTPREFAQVKSKLKLFTKRPELRAFITQDQKEGRLSGKMPDIGSAQATVENKKFRAFLQKNIDPTVLQTRLTGSALLMDKNNDNLTVNLMEGLLLDILMIGAIVGLMFKSFRMILITLIPNLFPIILIAAFMGLTGINLKVSTSIIFTIALGIAIDDTIHFISKLKLELLHGKPLFYALKRTYLTTGKAVIITSCILMSGFFTLLFSDFEGTFYVGLLISLTLFFAVFADLLLLPVLVIYFFRPKKVKDLPK